MDSGAQMDLDLARRDRDVALARVLDVTLVEACELALDAMPGLEVTGEDIRHWVQCQGREGDHPNAWGAAINALVRRGRLRRTGRVTPMKQRRSHARLTPTYHVLP